MKDIAIKRTMAATLANKFYKQKKDRKYAFKKAWEIANDTRPLGSRVAGVSFRNRQTALERLEKYEPGKVFVTLEREADNLNDGNAVKVLVNIESRDKYHLGYLPVKMAALLAPLLAKGFEPQATFEGVTGGYEGHATRGALIGIKL